jgi:hypothetical protein
MTPKPEERKMNSGLSEERNSTMTDPEGTSCPLFTVLLSSVGHGKENLILDTHASRRALPRDQSKWNARRVGSLK